MSPAEAGQMALLDAAKLGSMLVSLYMRLLKNWHCAWPMVWPPESTVRSRALNPLAANMDTSVGRSKNGEGISLLAALSLAVLASLLPSATAHEGPPTCQSNYSMFQLTHLSIYF